MTDLTRHFKTWLAPALIIALIAAVVWLAGGSSQQATLPGWQPGWGAATSFNYPRRAPAAVAHNGFLYVVGGIDGRDHYVHAVEYAPILKNGALGRWRLTSELIEGRFYNAVLAHKGYLYTLGGGAGPTGAANYPITTVERARIHADGSLGPWEAVGEMEIARRGLKAVIHDDTLYAIGGYDGSFLKSVERARIGADGLPGRWIVEKHESIIDRYIHSAAIYKDRIYQLGGHMRDPRQTSYGDVESAQIKMDSSLSQWSIETNALLTPRLVAEAFTLGRHLYIAGGHTGNERLTSVEISRIGIDGALSPWRQTTPLPSPRSAFAVATSGRSVYVLGGAGDNGPLNTVDTAIADNKGNLGVISSN